MQNARYSLLRIALELAEKDIHSVSLLIVSPSDQGKTDTLRLFARDHDGMWIIPPTSTSRLTEFFRQRRNITMIAIDEPYDWIGTDYRNAAMMCKHIIEGVIKAPRSTVFSTSVDMAKPASTGVVLMCNDQQYDKVRQALAGCGLLERSLTIMCQNSNTGTLDYIDEYYRTHRRDEIQFCNGFSFCSRDLSVDENTYINRYFSGYPRRTVQWIAKTIPPKIFQELKPYLLSGLNNQFVEEEIKFKED